MQWPCLRVRGASDISIDILFRIGIYCKFAVNSDWVILNQFIINYLTFFYYARIYTKKCLFAEAD